MAKFRYVECSIWENDDFLKLPGGSQHQFLYILTNPARTESGLFRLSKSTMFWRTHTNKKQFLRLTESALIEWDDRKDLVWITSALEPRYFRPSPNQWTSVKNDMALYYPHRFVKMLHDRYSFIYNEIEGAYKTLQGSCKTPTPIIDGRG